MSRHAACAVVTLLLVASGCAPGPLDDSAWPEPRPLGRDLDAVRPPRSPGDAGAVVTFDEPSGDLTLRDALAAALRRSPDLAATGFEVRAREAEALQAGRWPNPVLGLEFENFGATGDLGDLDTLETTLTLSQLVELGGKRMSRRRVADLEARIAGWDFEIRRVDVLSKTAADYVGLLAAERRLRIADESHALAERVFQAVEERVDAGKVSPVERTKARVELARAALGREQSVRAVAATRIRLASNWGSTDPRFRTLSGDLDHVEPPPTFEALLARVDRNPDLARWTAETALRQARVELARAARVPDLAVTGGVRYFDELDETAFVAALEMPLPLLDRKEGSLQAARFRALGEDRLAEAARVRIHTAVADAFQALDTAFVSVRTTRDEILPSATLAFEAAEEAFRQGKIGSLDLLDAERTLFEARRQLANALTAYHLSIIAGERLIGAPLHDDQR